MDTRAEITRQTKLPKVETTANFIKKKINQEDSSVLSPVVIRAKNPEVSCFSFFILLFSL